MKELWIMVGFLSMGIGVVGIFLPVLPTTPFFLLTAYAFNKGSSRFSQWFHKQTIVKKYLTYMTMTKRKKWILNLIVDAILIGYVIIFDHMILRIILISLILIKHYVFYKFVKTQ